MYFQARIHVDIDIHFHVILQSQSNFTSICFTFKTALKLTSAGILLAIFLAGTANVLA